MEDQQNQWEKLDDASQNISNEPWNLYWKEFKSGTKEFENFFHNPIEYLAGQLDNVTTEFRVHTNLIGHERGLSISEVCLLALVDPDSKVVYLTFYKH